MPNPVYIMQNSFAGGEVSPVIDGRQDLQKYASSLKTMKNFYALPHGAAVNRAGSYYIAKNKYSEKKSRLIPFRFSEDQAYVLEFGDQYIRFFRDGGQITVSGAAYEVITPYLEAEMADIKFTQSADVMYLVHPKHKPMTLSRYGDTNWVLADFSFHDGPFMPVNLTTTTITPSAVTGSITLTASANVFEATHVGSLFKLSHDVEAKVLSTSLNAVGATTSIRGKGTWQLTTHGTWTGSIYLERSKDSGETWQILRTYSSKNEYNPTESGTEDDEIVLLRIRAFSWSSGSVSIDLEFYPYTINGVVEITAVTSGTSSTATVKTELGATRATDVWNEGSWSTKRGWPAAVIFFQNRLFFGNTSAEPLTLWGSKTGDYINFGVSSPVEDDDAVSLPLVSENVNAIRSMKALSEIIGLTAGGHWKIGPSDSGALTPTSAKGVQQGSYGASSLDPIIIGNRILYTRSKGSIVQDIGYDFQSDSYMGTELTVLAEHLFRNKKIIDWAYQQEPNSIVWAVRDDGVLLGFTYLREQEVWSWHRHITAGQFESVCTIPGDGRDEVWAIMKRTVNGVTKRYIELFAARNTAIYTATDDNGEEYTYQKPEDQYFVDCGLTYSGAPATVFTGLDHLEGKTVAILADGNVHPQKVVSGGMVTLNYEASVVHIGLPYTCDLQTLNVEFQGRDGTIQTRFKKITKATLRVEDTRGAFVGPTFDNLYEIKMRENENWGDPIALFSGDKEISFDCGSNKEGRVCVRMSDPLPITLLAIVSEVTMDG